MRLLPKSLYGQLMLGLVVALVGVQLLSTGLHFRDRGRALAVGIGQQWAGNVAVMVQMMDEATPEMRERLAQQLTRRGMRVTLGETARPGGWIPTPAAHHFERMLEELIGKRDIALSWHARPDHMRHPQQMRPHRPMHLLDTTVRLRDGGWLTISQPVPAELFGRPTRLIWNLVLLLTAAALISWWLVRRTTRPLKQLAEAANELGSDIHRPPLTVAGPAEVAEAARAFNAMQLAIQQSLDERSRMLAAVSHDLKTPITRMRLRAELIGDETLREKQIADLEEMTAMVESTLELMRGIEPGAQTETIELAPFLTRMQTEFAESGEAFAVSVREDSTCQAEPRALRRVLENLIGNALRYGSEVEVKVSTATQTATHIEVCDHGPGIAEAQLEQVFDPFYRLEVSRSSESGGNGLGLAIARNLARAMGGDVRLRNRDSGGLCADLILKR